MDRDQVKKNIQSLIRDTYGDTDVYIEHDEYGYGAKGDISCYNKAGELLFELKTMFYTEKQMVDEALSMAKKVADGEYKKGAIVTKSEKATFQSFMNRTKSKFSEKRLSVPGISIEFLTDGDKIATKIKMLHMNEVMAEFIFRDTYPEECINFAVTRFIEEAERVQSKMEELFKY